MNAKYVVVKGNPSTMFIFNGWFSHSNFAIMFGKENIESAGFVNLKLMECYGKSESLKTCS